MNVLQQVFWQIYMVAYDVFPVDVNIVAEYAFNGFLFLVWAGMIFALAVMPFIWMLQIVIGSLIRLGDGGSLWRK